VAALAQAMLFWLGEGGADSEQHGWALAVRMTALRALTSAVDS